MAKLADVFESQTGEAVNETGFAEIPIREHVTDTDR
jgi:hypothetical protein